MFLYLCYQNRSVPHPQKFSINLLIAIIQRTFEEKKEKERYERIVKTLKISFMNLLEFSVYFLKHVSNRLKAKSADYQRCEFTAWVHSHHSV